MTKNTTQSKPYGIYLKSTKEWVAVPEIMSQMRQKAFVVTTHSLPVFRTIVKRSKI